MQQELCVKCINGVFTGKKSGSVLSFKGIPYAKAPTGDRRWKVPEEPDASNEIFEAYAFGKSPIQTECPSEQGSYHAQGEDCLTLNIWTNQKVSEGKTVMVFFHGGAYGWGGTSDPIYDGHNFVEAHPDIILVTVEYRTGIMGFIDFSAVKGGENFKESGNLGLLDMVCSLKWIQENIRGFGGNPDNVTIFGESAGAGAVSLLPLIDGTKGLFHRIIAESGSVALTYSKKECARLTEMLLQKTGASCMRDLMSLSEAELKEVNEKLNDYINFPERDGVILPKNLYEAYDHGKAAHVDMMIGTNADEVRYWIREMDYIHPLISGELIYRLGAPILYESDTKNFSAREKKYLYRFMHTQSDARVWNITEFYNEILFRVPALFQAEKNAKNGGNAYVYYWNYPSAIGKLGACHAVELSYVFNNLEETIYTGDNVNRKLAKTVQNMWVNFARTGNPSTERLNWGAYSADHRRTMILDKKCYMVSNLMETQRTAIEPLLKQGLNGCYTRIDFCVPSFYRHIAALVGGIGVITAAILLQKKK